MRKQLQALGRKNVLGGGSGGGCKGPELTVSGGVRNGKKAVWPDRVSRGELGALPASARALVSLWGKRDMIASLCDVKTVVWKC